MSRGVMLGVATCPHQLVGYWGCGNPAALAQSLRELLDQTAANWSIAFPPAADGLLATLSADGLASASPNDIASADIWLRAGEDCLILGRQAFGRVSLYWMQREQVVWFASQLQLLLPLVASPTVNLAALYGYSCFSYVPTPFTPVEQITAVSAGTEQTWRIDQSGNLSPLDSHCFPGWREEPNPIDNEQAAIAQLQTLLKAAVERQIADLHDQPVGVLLSGGLDSSIVAALLVQMGVKVRAYTLDFGSRGIAEYPYAQQVADWLNIPLVKVDATPRQIQSALIPTIKALDLPFGDGVTVPLFLLHQAASQDTQIIFNGEGGDQLFAGWTNKPLIAASIYQAEHPDHDESFEHHYLRTFHRLWGYEAQVFQPAVYAKIQQLQPQNWLHPALDSTATRSLLHRLRRASLMLKGAQNIHPRVTNLAFAHGLQVRSPFCDLSLAQWTFQLSGELCLQGACEKYILKRAVDSWLPPEIVWRQKRGMGVPLTAWCLNEWWRTLGIWLNPGTLEAEGRWQADLAAHIAFGNLGGMIQGRRIGEILWLLIVWQLWRSQILGEPLENQSWNHPFWLPYPVWRYGNR
ncbi:MAG: asparagine synthetase B family protein [Nodosilinea sp.]